MNKLFYFALIGLAFAGCSGAASNSSTDLKCVTDAAVQCAMASGGNQTAAEACAAQAALKCAVPAAVPSPSK